LVINPIGRIAEGTAQTMDGEVKVKLRITPLSKVFHVQLGLMSKLEGEIREIKETYDYAVENNQVGRFSLPTFVPDPIKYDDEYFGYSMKWQGPGDKKFRIIYDGEIRVNRGENAGKKYPVRIIINRKTDRAVIRRMDEKRDYKFPYKREVQMSGLRGLRDVANIVSTLVFKLKRHTEEIWTAYVIDSKGE
jgi:hypothetical protein